MDHSKWQKIIKDHGLRGSVGHALTVTGLISGTGQNVTPTLLYICKCVHRASVKVGEILVFLGGGTAPLQVIASTTEPDRHIVASLHCKRLRHVCFAFSDELG